MPKGMFAREKGELRGIWSQDAMFDSIQMLDVTVYRPHMSRRMKDKYLNAPQDAELPSNRVLTCLLSVVLSGNNPQSLIPGCFPQIHEFPAWRMRNVDIPQSWIYCNIFAMSRSLQHGVVRFNQTATVTATCPPQTSPILTRTPTRSDSIRITSMLPISECQSKITNSRQNRSRPRSTARCTELPPESPPRPVC